MTTELYWCVVEQKSLGNGAQSATSCPCCFLRVLHVKVFAELEGVVVSEQDGYKQQAAERAVELVTSGMIVGLGTGGTAIYAIRRIGALIHAGDLRDIVAVPTSVAIGNEARRLGMPLLDDAHSGPADITIDGADEVDPALDLIKGRGGALLREKIVAQTSRRFVIVADETKLSPALGTRQPLPVEVVPFGWRSQVEYVDTLARQARVSLRTGPGGAPFVTDQGNFILDCMIGPIERPEELAAQLQARAGVVAHGLFLGLATDVIVAGPSGVEHRIRR
jgi:ribose 5-phosphate isomerase A